MLGLSQQAGFGNAIFFWHEADKTGQTRLARYWARPRVSLVPMLALRVTKHCEGTPMWESLARLTSLYRSVPAWH